MHFTFVSSVASSPGSPQHLLLELPPRAARLPAAPLPLFGFPPPFSCSTAATSRLPGEALPAPAVRGGGRPGPGTAPGPPLPRAPGPRPELPTEPVSRTEQGPGASEPPSAGAQDLRNLRTGTRWQGQIFVAVFKHVTTVRLIFIRGSRLGGRALDRFWGLLVCFAFKSHQPTVETAAYDRMFKERRRAKALEQFLP